MSKLAFHVAYKLTHIAGKPVPATSQWRLYSEKLYTYRQACEEAESESRFCGTCQYQYKALHHKLFKGNVAYA